MNERQLKAREAELVAELDSRKTNSQRQAELAINGRSRPVATDERPEREPDPEFWGDEPKRESSRAGSASRRQASRVTRGGSNS